MKKYRVCGTTVVTVYKEVWAHNEDEAMDKANEQLGYLTAYCGNFGYDKLVGVKGDGESVDADGYIEWNDTEMLEEDPDYFECPECEEKCNKMIDSDGEEYWYCDSCYQAFDNDGYTFYPATEEEE